MTRHISEITAISSKFGNSTKIIVPRFWLGKRVIAFPYSEYISKHRRSEKGKMSSEALLLNIIPFPGSGLLGYAMGFVLKKMDANYRRVLLVYYNCITGKKQPKAIKHMLGS
jgi:hypothetical protein